ncbi:MAG: cupredoxin domain-containing protein [Candidatus Eremiobacteraeota bacterium]|nr:cupredoxin domain-containing protein [Candidatus Eremiobacteraeota bacterium]MBV8722134.1 cupredoxin domain-containing protein [Candidatus Eremiobacteraeota bacterium]
MSRVFRISFIAAIGVFLLAPLGALAHPSVDIALSGTAFTPSEIELHVGETTTLRLLASEGTHVLQSDDVGIPKTTIPPDQTTAIVVTPKKAGTFQVHCMATNGAEHTDMILTVKVLP